MNVDNRSPAAAKEIFRFISPSNVGHEIAMLKNRETRRHTTPDVDVRRSVLQNRAVDTGFDEQLRQVTTRIKYPCLHGIAGDADGLGSLLDRLPMVVDEIDASHDALAKGS